MSYTNRSIHCCRYCGKNYKNKTNLEKHIILCEFIYNSKSGKTFDEEEIPSQRKMYQIILELGNKCNKLEERFNELNKWVVKKKKKINVVEWLNGNMIPEIHFDRLNEIVVIEKEDISHLFKHSFADTLDHIFSRNIYNIGNEYIYPIFAFNQKSNLFYIYENKETGWLECNNDRLASFLNKVHMKIHRVFMEWKKNNAAQIAEDENLSILCDKTSVKLLDVSFQGPNNNLNKIKTNMYLQMKNDIKALVEYEFEF
jgi:hypothetical protein